ncbi:hypothetical protein [Bacillus toyonensis]|uniref:hypothetical protein n=1 Tax=Bacillus toyonensis TaxID=155322 RepID=UPI000BFC6298|nr:hypothetical protein [Bacillus toyonensis]PHD85489.1 hypothetical protein COF55_25160 [Bacillus toyonensis]
MIQRCARCNKILPIPNKAEYLILTFCSGCKEIINQIDKFVEDAPLLVIEVKDMSSVPTVIYNGETIEGKVSITYEWGTSGYKKEGKHVLNLNHVYHVNNQLVERTIKEEKITGYVEERTNHLKNACDNKTSVAELPERYRGIKLSETSLNIRNEIIKNDIDYLKDITPEQMELLVQLFEKEKTKKG